MDGLFIVDCTPLTEERLLAEGMSLLDTDRQNRIQRLPDPLKKAQRAAAGLLLTHLFGENGTPPRLRHGSRGKPYLYDREDAFFSLSHTGRWVLCATADGDVGMDAQTIGPYREQVAARCFTEEEQNLTPQTGEGFTALWTAKEAYIKYTGFGLVLPMSCFSVPIPTTGWDEVNRCHWWNSRWEDLHVTVCCEQEWDARPILLDIEKSLLR